VTSTLRDFGERHDVSDVDGEDRTAEAGGVA
jgi:hypothetical protein